MVMKKTTVAQGEGFIQVPSTLGTMNRYFLCGKHQGPTD